MHYVMVTGSMTLSLMCWQWTEVYTRHQQEAVWKLQQGGWQERSTQRWWVGRSVSQV